MKLITPLLNLHDLLQERFLAPIIIKFNYTFLKGNRDLFTPNWSNMIHT